MVLRSRASKGPALVGERGHGADCGKWSWEGTLVRGVWSCGGPWVKASLMRTGTWTTAPLALYFISPIHTQSFPSFQALSAADSISPACKVSSP